MVCTASDSVIPMHISIYFFPLLGYYKMMECRSLCSTVGPCWLSVWCPAMCKCSSQAPHLSLPRLAVSSAKEMDDILLFLGFVMFFGSEACGILIPRPGIKRASPELEGEVLTTEPPGKSRELGCWWSCCEPARLSTPALQPESAVLTCILHSPCLRYCRCSSDERGKWKPGPCFPFLVNFLY